MNIRVDPELCVGTGECSRIAPQTFRLGASDVHAVVLQGAQDVDETAVRLAVESCPMQAISVEPDYLGHQ